ncbi:MAG TPA: zinc ribbon domain-containing protein [bacterium]|nr:zinc ribbon domain-containing protein [bacterium]
MSDGKKKTIETMAVEGDWNVGAYQFKAPTLLPEFAAGLKEGKLIGTLCRGCGKVIVPPRNICGRCHRRMEDRIVVSDKGTISVFVMSEPVQKDKFKLFGMDPIDMGLLKEGEVIMPVFVRFDGSDSNVHTVLINADPKEVRVGMRVKAVFAKERKGALSDLEGVEPLEE